MCRDCGCSEANALYFNSIPLNHNKIITGKISIKPKRTIEIEKKVLSENDQFANSNKDFFLTKKICALNLMSSPGAGKTYLLEETLKYLKNEFKLGAIVGDQETDLDAIRLKRAEVFVKQINTFSSCHLNAKMINDEINSSLPSDTQILFIENVGNLVCPAAFDLGENIKVALLSITEGEDKPLKYPVLFNEADIILLTKSDLKSFVEWNEELCRAYIKKINPNAKIILLSAKSGDGMDEWYKFIKERLCV